MDFADIHIHALFGVDDGAKSADEMYAMLDASYKDGVRELCFTPHCHPGYFGDNREKTEQMFSKIFEMVQRHYPALNVCLGNELRYSDGCESWLADGVCRTMNCTDLVLVDFFENDSARTIRGGIDRLLNAGYTPILAHAERYGDLQLSDLYAIKNNGVHIQIDTQSLVGGFGRRAARRCRHLLENRLVSFAASDSHDLKKRPPGMSECYKLISKLCSERYARVVCHDMASELIFAKDTKGMGYINGTTTANR